MRRNNDALLQIMIFDLLKYAIGSDKYVVIIKTGNRVINKDMCILLVSPSIYFQKCQEETPNKNSLFTARYLDGSIFSLWQKERDRFDSQFRISMRIELKSVYRPIHSEFF